MNRALKRILIGSISIVLLAVLAVVFWLVWGSWVSPLERRAMNDALDRIDEVASYGGSDAADYRQKVQAAKAAMDRCQRKALTSYDRQLEPLLTLQLDGAQAEHTARMKAGTDARFAKMLGVVSDGNRQTEAMLRSHLQ